MSTSHYSRPVAHDQILSAWLNNPHRPENILRRRRFHAALWFAAGAILAAFDVAAVGFFATDAVETLILCALTLPTAAFLMLAALEARK